VDLHLLPQFAVNGDNRLPGQPPGGENDALVAHMALEAVELKLAGSRTRWRITPPALL